MRFELKRKIYEQSPSILKRVSKLVPFPILAGKSYRATYKRKQYFDSITKVELDHYVERQLQYWLNYAVHNVPFYFDLKAIVDRLQPFEALKAFPLLEKKDLQADPEVFTARNMHSNTIYKTTTGGTSGNQLEIFLQDNSHYVETAFIHRLWSIVDYSYRLKKASFRGVTFSNLDPDRPWQHNPVYNEIQFSPFHLTDSNLEQYYEQFSRFRPDYFHGYPSAIDVLAEFALRKIKTEDRPILRGILLGSEGVSRAQKARMMDAFSCRVYSWYGQSERVVLAGECEVSDSYHVVPDYGYCEIVDEGGERLASKGSRGEIVGTSFQNHVMPLIRYKTGDLATKLNSECECKRCWERFSEVEGRWKQDVIVGKNSAKISLAALNIHGHIFEKVKRYQYHQTTPGKLTIRILAETHLNDKELFEIKNAFDAKVKGSLDVDVIRVRDIPLTPRGKLQRLISDLDSSKLTLERPI